MIPGFEYSEKYFNQMLEEVKKIKNQLYYEEKIKLLNLAEAKTK